MQITQFTKPVADGHMTKTIKLGPDGKPTPDGSACRMWRGEARVYDLMDVHELALLIDKCSTQQALAFGSIKPEFLNGGGSVKVVKKDALASPTPGVIARTNKHLWFPPGEDGAMVVDHDRKGMPANVEAKIAGRSLWDVLIEVAPGLAQAGRVERASTSAGLMNTATGECFDSGGQHIFIHVADAADIPRATKALHDRCTLDGYGWAIVSKSGQILQRSIADRAVGTAEHLSFEGPPVVAAPLMQDADTRKPKATTESSQTRERRSPISQRSRSTHLRRCATRWRRALAAEAAEAKRLHMDALTARVLKDPKCKTPAGLLRDRLMLAYQRTPRARIPARIRRSGDRREERGRSARRPRALHRRDVGRSARRAGATGDARQ